ncbi:uncharacterized protein LOC113465161 [Ceratina calcarata]|uniref:Uncharacterized protein LOC113465161 n=1 Tax=Ceratina calcarata TaxID=156304 RepID=A0AAJ7SBL7_9HYME|nr:uncharacterized protein LOC113465161 [Ceratina calcarata]
MSSLCTSVCRPECRTECKRIRGKKWEYPVKKSKEYWEKFCDDEEKKLIVVRNPFLRLPYHSSSKNDSQLLYNVNLGIQNNNIADGNSASHIQSNYTNNCKVSSNSLHKLLPAKSKSKSNYDIKKKSALKVALLDGPKILDTKCNLASPKVVRIPKLDTSDPQPSSRGIRYRKVDDIRAPFNVQNGAEVQGESSPSLPYIETNIPKTLDLQLTLKKLQDELRVLEEKNSKIRDRRQISETKPKERIENQIRTENQKEITDDEFLKYSAHFAQKTLKRLIRKRNPNFKFGTIDYLQQKRVFKSSTDSSSSCDETKDSVKIKIIEENIIEPNECSSVKSNETESRTIFTSSRSTSGPSPKFMYPDDWRSSSSQILSSIPELSSYPRKNCDRCLRCMYKPFEIPLERKTSLPRTVLRRIIEDTVDLRQDYEEDSSEDSDSTSAIVPNFKNEVERILCREVKTKNITFDEKSCFSATRLCTQVDCSFQEKHGQTEMSEQKSILESGFVHETIMKKTERDQQADVTTSTILNNPTAISSTKVLLLQRMKLPSTFHSESVDEDESTAVSIGDEQMKPKYLVPCHAPTNFRPSLEHLRALRNRKPTTLQDRIQLLESASSKKGVSVDDYDDVMEKPRSVPEGVYERDKTENEGMKRAGPQPLTKAKSFVGKPSLEEAKARTEKQRHSLKKGASFPRFSVSTDTVSNKSDASKDALRELKTTRDDDFTKTSYDFSGIEDTKLPLTRMNEVLEILWSLAASNASPLDMLEALCKEFSERLLNQAKSDDLVKHDRIVRLTRLLVDSKRYLHADIFPSNLVFSTNQPPPCNPRLLRRIFPLKTYNLVAPVLGMPEIEEKKKRRDEESQVYHRESVEEEASSPFDSLEVHPPTLTDTESPRKKGKVGHRRYNPYALFLVKPRRKVVTWRQLTKRDLEGYDPDATLEMRADNSMKRICQDFCQWVETLGGTDNAIDEQVLRDMFEIDFSAEACRAMQVLIQEMPVVPAEVALTRNCPEAGKLNMTKKHVMKDVKAERTPAKIKAFGTAIPWKLRFVPPNNQVENRWLRCENVPKDIETMEVVWKDITHLRSVLGFVEWLQQHPEVSPPNALRKIALMDIKDLRQIEEDETFAHLELDIAQIESLRVAVNGEDVM